MSVLDLISSDFACSRFFRMVRWYNGVYCPRYGSFRVRGIIDVVLNDTSVRLVVRLSTIRLEHYSTILGLALESGLYLYSYF